MLLDKRAGGFLLADSSPPSRPNVLLCITSVCKRSTPSSPILLRLTLSLDPSVSPGASTRRKAAAVACLCPGEGLTCTPLSWRAGVADKQLKGASLR